jgi:hypothetical protein
MRLNRTLERLAARRTYQAFIGHRPCTYRGYPVGGQHHRARYGDDAVAFVRHARGQGWGLRELARLLGAAPSTIHAWLHGARPKPDRIAARYRRMPL